MPGCDIEQWLLKIKKHLEEVPFTCLYPSSLFLHFRNGFLFFLTELIAIRSTYTRRTCRGAWRGGGWASCWLTRHSSWPKSASSPFAPPAGTSPAISVGKRTALPKQEDFFGFFYLCTVFITASSAAPQIQIEPRTVATSDLCVTHDNGELRRFPYMAFYYLKAFIWVAGRGGCICRCH